MRTNALMVCSFIISMMGVYFMRMYIEGKHLLFMLYAGLLMSGAAFFAALAVSMCK